MTNANLTEDGQDQAELFDVMPAPSFKGIQIAPEVVAPLAKANLNGIEFPTISRSEANSTGAWHRSVGVWLYTKEGDILLQKRSLLKDTNPGRWQMSVAGHVTSGDSVHSTILNEAAEELGLSSESLAKLQFLGLLASQEHGSTDRFGEYLDAEYKFIYLCETDREIALTLNALEISEVRWEPIETVFANFKGGNPAYCPMTVEYAEFSQAQIKAKLAE